MDNNTNTQQKVYTRTLEQTKERLAMVQQQEKDFNRELSDNYKQMRQLELKKRRIVKKISSHMKYITQLEEEVKSKQQHTIEGDKSFKVKDIGWSHENQFGKWYSFSTDKQIHPEKYLSIKSAIEKTLNNEVDNPVLERQGMSINNISDLYNNGRFTTMTDQPQEVKEPNKDWEVLEVVDFRRGVIKVGEGTLFNYVDGEPIHSVRRISDGEVFSVGDETANGKITGFDILGFTRMHIYSLPQNITELKHAKKITKEEEPKPVRQMWNRHSGIHDENDVCAHLGCEEYNPLDGRHR